MQNTTHVRFRPQALPSPGVPLGARSAGDYRVYPGWKDIVAAKTFWQLYWGVEGYGRMTFPEGETLLRPGMIALYPRGMVHRIEAADVFWHYRWLTVDGPEASALIASLGLKAGVHPAGPAPARLLNSLDKLIARGLSLRDELAAGALAYRLLCEAAAQTDRTTDTGRQTPLTRKAVELCLRRAADPDCNVASLAAQLGVHRSLLSRAFSKETGTVPSEFLSRIRIDNARSLLRETGASVSDISRQCGFADTNYFVRRFKAVEGITPGDFRKRGQESARAGADKTPPG